MRRPKAYKGIKVRRLADGPATLTNQTRWTHKDLYAKPQRPQWTQPDRWTGLIHFCQCGRTTDHRKVTGPSVRCSCGTMATVPNI